MRYFLGRRGPSMSRMGRRWGVSRVFLAGVAALVLCTMVFQPFRSVLMGPFIPQTWADTDTVHLFRVLHDFQDIPTDSQPISKDPSWSQVQVNMSQHTLFFNQAVHEYPEFWSYLLSHEKDPPSPIYNQISIFQPSLNPTEKSSLMFAFATFHHACQTAGLTYFILEASLMGVLRHHGPIPWDDDIDVVMSFREWVKIRDVLGNINGFELFSPPSSQWKFYMDNSKRFPDKPFKFPYVDIFFYDEDDTHVWALTKGLKHDLVYDKRDVFPLQKRPYAGLMVPVPCNLDLIVNKAHDKTKCVTPEYNHKVNDYESVRVVDCSILHDLYPFVFVEKTRNPLYDIEHLKIGNRVIQSVNVTTGCPGKVS